MTLLLQWLHFGTLTTAVEELKEGERKRKSIRLASALVTFMGNELELSMNCQSSEYLLLLPLDSLVTFVIHLTLDSTSTYH